MPGAVRGPRGRPCLPRSAVPPAATAGRATRPGLRRSGAERRQRRICWAGRAPLPSRSTELANGGQDGGRSADSRLRGRQPAPGSPTFREDTTFPRNTRPPSGNADNALGAYLAPPAPAQDSSLLLVSVPGAPPTSWCRVRARL